MLDAYTTFLALSNDAPNVYIATKMIELSERNLVTSKVFDAYPLEQKMSKTVRAVRVKRLSLPTTPLVEGVTPSSVALELENVDTVLEQWGLVALLTDVVQLTVKHPMLNIAIERVSMALKESFEREDANVMLAGTNVTYAKLATTRAGLVATDIADTALFIACTAKLAMRGAPRFTPDGLYVAFIQPPHTAALMASDAVFQQASAFSRIQKLEYGYLGTWMRMDCVEGNFLPVFIGVPAPDTGATTALKAQYTVGTAGSLATANFQLKVVARELITDYERRLSVQTGNIAVTSPGSIAVTMPTSVNYTYDVYMTQAGGTTAFKVASRQAANSVYVITTAPVGTEAVAPASPANGIPVYPGWVIGKGALGTSVLNGMALQTYVTPNGPSDSDPLAQRKKIGAKVMRKSWIQDNAFFERFETSSALQPAIPA
ncbi:MAG: N4-gp56 family major capsid protein [Cetobacterium sp.]